MKSVWDLIFGERKEYVFHSDLRTDECISIFKGSVSTWIDAGSTEKSKEVSGHFKHNKFQLVKRLGNFRNPFNPIFYGKLENANGGTRITGHFSIQPFVTVYLIVWVTGIILFSVIVMLRFLPLIFALLLMLLEGILLVIAGRYIGQPEEKTVLDYIQKTLNASPVMPEARSANSSDKQSP